MSLSVISAGAAKGIVAALAGKFRETHGEEVESTFGAVGAMREKLLAGERCDVVVLTQSMIVSLARDGHVDEHTIRPLGVVYTGVATRAGDPAAAIADEASLRETLRHATSVHFPDPALATAGIHFAKVLATLGLHDVLAQRLRPHPNGATAMAALARAVDARPIGCTQVSEILYTPGVTLSGALPKAFELATRYDAATCTRSENPTLAAAFAMLIGGPASASLRETGGFEQRL